MTIKKRKFIEALPTATSLSDAVRKAGYSDKGNGVTVVAQRLKNDPELQDKLERLGIIGLDTLEDVAINGNVEIARVASAKILVETAYGKPKDYNGKNSFGDLTINITKGISNN